MKNVTGFDLSKVVWWPCTFRRPLRGHIQGDAGARDHRDHRRLRPGRRGRWPPDARSLRPAAGGRRQSPPGPPAPTGSFSHASPRCASTARRSRWRAEVLSAARFQRARPDRSSEGWTLAHRSAREAGPIARRLARSAMDLSRPSDGPETGGGTAPASFAGWFYDCRRPVWLALSRRPGRRPVQSGPRSNVWRPRHADPRRRAARHRRRVHPQFALLAAPAARVKRALLTLTDPLRPATVKGARRCRRTSPARTPRRSRYRAGREDPANASIGVSHR